MAAPWRKRRKVFHDQNKEEFEVKYPDVVIFIVNARIQRVRLMQLRRLARTKGFVISYELSDAVTHVVTEINTRDHVISILQRITRSQQNSEFDVLEFAQKVELLSLTWFTACMEEGKPVEVTDEHRLPARKLVDPDEEEGEEGEEKPKNRKFACQRITPVNNANKKFTDALELLEKAAELRLGDSSRSRSLAFRKASAALKALPEEITKPEDIENLYDLKGGVHCKQVVLDILERGFSTEVEGILRSGWYQSMSLFTGVFGCGTSTAAKWCNMGLRSLADVKASYILNLTRSQLKGMEYYDELNCQVTREEANWIYEVVAKEVADIRPGSTVVITGGFLRGKDSGHDVDFLISHPEEGKEEGILSSLLQALSKKGLLDYTDIVNHSLHQRLVPKGADVKKNTMDHYERCFSIFRLPKSAESHRDPIPDPTLPSERTLDAESTPMDTSSVAADGSSASQGATASGNANGSAGGQTPANGSVVGSGGVTGNGSEVVDTGRSWVARRVDFVIAPAGQYPFALLGWTGSKMFNRSMRDYANKVMNMNLTSHGLFDKTNNCSVTAKSEEEIFELLKLEYRRPEERNC